jgi:hypothetical protein
MTGDTIHPIFKNTGFHGIIGKKEPFNTIPPINVYLACT